MGTRGDLAAVVVHSYVLEARAERERERAKVVVEKFRRSVPY